MQIQIADNLFYRRSAVYASLCLLSLASLSLYGDEARAEEQVPSQSEEAPAERPADLPRQYEGVGVTERLGEQLPLDLTFVDEAGETIPLGSLFKSGKPVVLSLVYFNCPMLCNLVLNGLVRGLRDLDWTLGEDYQAISVSISPNEGPELARAKKANYIAQLGEGVDEQGWRFLTGARPEIKALADAVGFGYRYDPATQDYAHSAVIFIISPEGKVSRYLHNITFEAQQLRLALTEAGEGKTGSLVDQLILRCFRYEPDAQRYSFYIWGAVRLGGVLTILILGGFLLILWRGERRAARRAGEASADLADPSTSSPGSDQS